MDRCSGVLVFSDICLSETFLNLWTRFLSFNVGLIAFKNSKTSLRIGSASLLFIIDKTSIAITVKKITGKRRKMFFTS